jgi:hypothetical protein
MRKERTAGGAAVGAVAAVEAVNARPEVQTAIAQGEAASAEPQQAAAPEEVEPEIPAAVQEEQSMPEAKAVDKDPVNFQGMPSDYAPMLLPGESIARYSRGADAGPREESDRSSEPRQEFQSRRDDFRGGRGGRDRDRGRGRGDRGDRGRDREREPRDREPREEYSLPENYTPIVLPGESISKYRKPESASTTRAEVAPSEARHFDSDSAVAAIPATTPETEAGASPEPATMAEIVTPDVAPATTSVSDEAASYEAALGGDADASVTEADLLPYRQPTAPVIEQHLHQAEPEATRSTLNESFHDDAAPAVVPRAEHEDAKAEAEQEKQWEPRSPADEPLATPAGNGEFLPTPSSNQEIRAAEHQVSAHDEHAAAPQTGNYSPEGGPVVHEELDEEETDMPSYAEQFNTDGHQEIVEQVFDRLAANGDLLGQTVRETSEEHALEESEYDFDPEDADEFEESEITAEPEFAGEEEGEDYQRPAQVRTGDSRPDRQGAHRQEGRAHHLAHRPARPLPGLHAHRLPHRRQPQDRLRRGAPAPQAHSGPRARRGLRRIHRPHRRRGRIGRRAAHRPALAAQSLGGDQAALRLLQVPGPHLSRSGAHRAHPARSGQQQLLLHLGRFPGKLRAHRPLPQPLLAHLVRRVKLYTKETPLFEHFGIQEEISKALNSKVWLKSGGSIVINQTEALVAIDINTGKYVGKSARLEDTIVKTNLDAVPEIVRQIRLRDLGGIIVIDFIDMDDRKNRFKVMAALEEALKSDRAPTKVLQFNDFGLVAITRKRVKQSLERTLGSLPHLPGHRHGQEPDHGLQRDLHRAAQDEDLRLHGNPACVVAVRIGGPPVAR